MDVGACLPTGGNRSVTPAFGPLRLPPFAPNQQSIPRTQRRARTSIGGTMWLRGFGGAARSCRGLHIDSATTKPAAAVLAAPTGHAA